MELSRDLDRSAFPKLYAVAGRLIFVDSSSSLLDQLIQQLFSGWLLNPILSSLQAPDIRIVFAGDDVWPSIPEEWNRFEIAEGGWCHTNGDSYYLDLGRARMYLAQHEEISVTVWLKEVPDKPDALLARITSFAVCAALRRCGLFEIHAAGVVPRDSERGVLIVGKSGSGKSTLTTQLARCGWKYLSDDELLLGEVDGHVEARGFRSFFAISPDSGVATALKDLGHFNLPAQRTTGLKTCFEPATVFPLAHIDRVVPTVLLFASVSGERETRIAQLTQSETMKRLIRACPWATYDRAIASKNLDVLSVLARQTKGFDLIAGSEMLEQNRAAELLGKIVTTN